MAVTGGTGAEGGGAVVWEGAGAGGGVCGVGRTLPSLADAEGREEATVPVGAGAVGAATKAAEADGATDP